MAPSSTPDSLHARAKRVFSEALEQPPGERPAFVAAACGSDAELQREVASLLGNFDETTSLFDAPAITAVDTMIGRRIGAYQILRPIGRGGMGAVYLAERADGEFRKRVALKAVRPGLLDEHVLGRFRNERQTLAVLDHPAIIKLLDAGATEDGVPYLVMEYVEGQRIDTYCEARRLSVRERVQLFRVVLGAVHFAHQNLIVHRDLKPSNILVTAEGAPKLLDFGIAKLLRPEFGAHMGLTRTELQPMTPEFASPEQILGQPINTASDTYSLGVILYRLLTGRHPYELKTHTPAELERAICVTEPERPSRFAARSETAAKADASLLRGDLDTIVLMAMRKEPQRRYASAEHFSEDLRRHLEGFPVLARKAGAAYRLSKFVGRHRVACAAGVVAVGALAFSGVTAIQEKHAAERRFQDLRKFANFALNELDGKLREGTTPARAELVAKSLEYLDRLAAEIRDPTILRDLVNGYIKVGDVQGNLYEASMGMPAVAEASYRKALQYAQDLARSAPGDIANQRNMVQADLKLGEVLAVTGNRAEALKRFDEALRLNEAVLASRTGDLDVIKDTYTLWSDVASARSLNADAAGALEAYRRLEEAARRFPDSYASKPLAFAMAKEQEAYWGALAGEDAGGENGIREAIAEYQRALSAKRSAGRRRTLGKAWKNLAELRKRAGRFDDALASIRQSIEVAAALAAEDPKSAQYRIDVEQAMFLEISILQAHRLEREAREETRGALDMMKPFADDPAAPYQFAADYAELLATTPFADLRDDAAALRYARTALAKTHEMDPGVWHVMALAYERAGDHEHALEADRKAAAQRGEHR
jgi:non-specific serine/threonine protein kinase/serine/threonine-protein kinase